MSVHSDQHDPTSTFIFPSDQGHTTSDNSLELEEHAEAPSVQ